MVKKVVSQRKHAGFEAPRNSLELLGQTCPRGVRDYIPYTYELKHGWPKIPTEEKSMKRKSIINNQTTENRVPTEEENSMKRKSTNNQTTENRVPNSRLTTPSVVARLMGMDMDMFPTTVNHQRKQVHNIRSEEDDSHRVVNHHNHRREHPQDEELQKFKKEFESWQQIARFKRTIPKQLIAQKILNREEFLYSDSIRSRSRSSIITNEKSIIELEEDHAVKSRMYFSNMIGNSSSGPRKIVILRPGSIDRYGDGEEESWVGSSSNTNSIEEFLEEVKERLKSEFQGKYCLNHLKTSEKPLVAMKKQIANSFRHTSDDSVHIMHHHRKPSLIRSLSAPVSGTSFGKLLLEDRHILTGAHIRRKHEAVEKKKEKLELKETVSNFQHSCTLGEQLFERRFQLADDMYSCRNDIMSGPTVVMNYGNIQENATEVPPSPASTLSPIRESSLPQVFREINSNLNELRRQLNALESNSRKDTETEEDEHPEAEMEEDPAETYIRELLIVSGLYYHYSSTTLSIGGEKPINNHVFKTVEKSYMKMSKNGTESKMNRRLLFDLTNEAIIVGVATESGSKLLNSVWERIRTYLYPAPDKFHDSIEVMVGRDMRSTAWTMAVKDEEVDCVGKVVETRITARLIEEVVKDLQHLHLERRWRMYNR